MGIAFGLWGLEKRVADKEMGTGKNPFSSGGRKSCIPANAVIFFYGIRLVPHNSGVIFALEITKPLGLRSKFLKHVDKLACVQGRQPGLEGWSSGLIIEPGKEGKLIFTHLDYPVAMTIDAPFIVFIFDSRNRSLAAMVKAGIYC